MISDKQRVTDHKESDESVKSSLGLIQHSRFPLTQLRSFSSVKVVKCPKGHSLQITGKHSIFTISQLEVKLKP